MKAPTRYFYSPARLRKTGPDFVRIGDAGPDSLRAAAKATQQTIWDLLVDLTPERDRILKDTGKSEIGRMRALQELGTTTTKALATLRSKPRAKAIGAAVKELGVKVTAAIAKATSETAWDEKVIDKLLELDVLKREAAIATAARTGDAGVVGAIERAPKLLEVATDETVATARELLGQHLEPDLTTALAEAEDLQRHVAALFDGAERLIAEELRTTTTEQRERTRGMLEAQQATGDAG